MSHHTLQKMVVRLLFDETFAATVYENPDAALSGLDLTEVERAQLLSVDRRAWRHDALRQRRTLRTLVEEFKISTTVILAETRSLASLERFFSTSFFHQAVQARGSLGLSFSEFLLDGCRNNNWTAPQLPDLIRLEAALASCRRALAREGSYVPDGLPATLNDHTRIRLAHGYGLGSFQANTIATIQHVERYLFELSLMPAMALCDDAPRLTGLPDLDAQKKTYLLFGPGAAGISLTDIDKTTYLVLYEARRPSEINSLLNRLGPGSARRAPEILSEWLGHGALMIIS